MLLFTAARGITMQQFMRKFTQLNGVEAIVTLEHCLFDKQKFYCNNLQTVNDDEKIGVLLKGQANYVDKNNAIEAKIEDGAYQISDKRLTIIVNKV